MEALQWRPVPIRPEVLGEIAASSRPAIWHLLVTCDDCRDSIAGCFLRGNSLSARGLPGYVASLSSSTMIYKALCAQAVCWPSFIPTWPMPNSRRRSRSSISATRPMCCRRGTGRSPSARLRTTARSTRSGAIAPIWRRALQRCRSICTRCSRTGGSDSTSLDEIVELLSHNGRTVGEALRMLVPPGQSWQPVILSAVQRRLIEPWDGPAALAFTDGHQVGAILDRNGLRPCRFALDDTGLVVRRVPKLAWWIWIPTHIVHSGRLGPGQMIVADLDFNRFFENDEILRIYDTKRHYQDLIQLRYAAGGFGRSDAGSSDPAELNRLQHRFGYTREDVRMILQPMATDGKDAVWSMGDDTSIAPLARAPRPLYAFFRQRFAQVTNPPIDPLRETVVLQMHTRLGPWPHILNCVSRFPAFRCVHRFLYPRTDACAARRRHHPQAGEDAARGSALPLLAGHDAGDCSRHSGAARNGTRANGASHCSF